MKKILFITLAVVISMAANAQNQVWTDIVTAQPSGYAVDANGDVEISSAEGLAWLISVVNGLNGCEPYDFDGHAVSLVSDVDLGGNEWVPVGDAVASPRLPFKGVFDGNRHVISNLNIYDHSFSKQYLGLFGYVSGAEIHDVALDGGNVYGGSYCGGVAGWGDDGSIIDNCHINMTVGSDFYPGGVVGRNRNSTVRNCCYVDDDFMAWDTYSGGIAGINESDGGNAVVENCYFDSKSEYTLNTRYFGGIVGHNSVIGTEGNAIVRNCYARLVEHIGNEGAIVGQNDGGEVSNCYYNSGYDIPVIGNGDMTSVDCSRFFINENVGAVLQTPVSIGENVIDNLLDALNAWVSVQTSPTLYNEWCESSELLPFFCYLIFADVDESYVSENAVNVYPNPASGSISVSVNSGAEIGSVSLHDVSGRLVKAQQSGFGSIDISGLATGMYVMKVTLDDGKVFEEKIVKE
ncbi:MAG: T9SS type A sorting domain-containing protein [Bacteroidia bacterium]|nr:T9SS type A sorting domain-containing protein [Bacteroidia bacterium]